MKKGAVFCLRGCDFCLKKGVVFLFERACFCPRRCDFRLEKCPKWCYFCLRGRVFLSENLFERVLFLSETVCFLSEKVSEMALFLSEMV